VDDLFAAVGNTVRGLLVLAGQAAHGHLVAIGVLVWLVVVARIALRRPRPRRERVSYGGAPPPRTLPTRRVEVEPAPPANPATAAMPAPSDALADADQPCAHPGVEEVWAGGRLIRYTCANWRCPAVWPPGTTFPPGTVNTPGARDD